MFKSIDDVKAANAKSSQPFWFDEATMEFFDTQIETPLCHDHFVTSEVPASGGERRFTVRLADQDAHIKTVGEFNGHATLPAAVAAMKTHVFDVQVEVPEAEKVDA